MATKFGYIRRDEKSRVDWQEVGKSASDAILAERDRRVDLKAKIKTDSDLFETEVYNLPETDNNNLKNEMLSAANLISEKRLRQDRSLADGSLRLRDYTIQRQNLVGVGNDANELNKSRTETDKLFQDLVDAGNINPQSVAVRADLEKYLNLNNYGIQLTEDGNGFLAKRIQTENADGTFEETYSTNPKDIFSLKGAKANMGRILQMPELHGANGIITTIVGLAAETWQNPESGFKSVDDAWLNKNYQELIKAEIKSSLVNPDVASGIAGQYLQGYEYEFLKDGEKSKGGTSIPLKQNGRGTWEFDDESEQGKKVMTAVEDKMMMMVRGRMGKKSIAYSPNEIKAFQGLTETKTNAETTARLIGDIQQGSAKEVKSAIVYFEGSDAKITDFTIEDSGRTLSYTVTDSNGNQTERILNRSYSTEQFMTQMAKQVGDFDLDRLMKTDAYKAYENNLVESGKGRFSYSDLGDEISFGGTTTSPPKAIDNLNTMQTLGPDGETLISSKENFKTNYPTDPAAAITEVLEKSNFQGATLVENEGFLVINIPNVTTGAFVVEKGTSSEKVIKYIITLQNAARANKTVSPKETGISEANYGKATGLTGQELKDSWNGGAGDDTNTEAPTDIVDGSIFNNIGSIFNNTETETE